MDALAWSINTPQKALPSPAPSAKDINKDNGGDQVPTPVAAPMMTPGTSQESGNPSSSDSTLTQNDCDCETCKKLGPAPPPISGKKWVPVWSLQESISPTSDPDPPLNKSFEELVLDKMKGPTDKPPVKRRKVHLKAKV